MSFTHRSILPKDMESCASNLRENFAYDPGLRRRLLSLWQELDSAGGWNTVAIDDRRLLPGERLVGFGISVFVTEAFTARALKGLPLISHAFLEQWEKGDRPYLSRKEVAKANSGTGLNLLVLHYGWNEKKINPVDIPKVQLKQTERFIEQHAGYRVKEYMQEVHGPYLRDFVLRAGSVLRHDYQEKKWKAALKGVSKADWPYLTGFRPEETLANPGTAASIFQAKTLQPRFRLSPSEQKMLELALEGKTDEQMASSLDLSHWTVKKRWQSVYLKVKKADPDLVDDSGSREAGEGRNRQRRRHLMDYLRNHQEELRPRA